MITPLESQEAMLPPTEDREMSVTGARCSLYSSCPSTRYCDFFFATSVPGSLFCSSLGSNSFSAPSPPAADLRPANGFTDWVTLFRGCLLIALLALLVLVLLIALLVLAGLLLDEVPVACWVVPLLVFVLVVLLEELVTEGVM